MHTIVKSALHVYKYSLVQYMLVVSNICGVKVISFSNGLFRDAVKIFILELFDVFDAIANVEPDFNHFIAVID